MQLLDILASNHVMHLSHLQFQARNYRLERPEVAYFLLFLYQVSSIVHVGYFISNFYYGQLMKNK